MFSQTLAGSQRTRLRHSVEAQQKTPATLLTQASYAEDLETEELLAFNRVEQTVSQRLLSLRS